MTVKAQLDFDLYNEIISVLVFFGVLMQVLRKGKVHSTIFVFLTWLSYLLILIFYRGLPSTAYLQVLIYCQFFFYFLYFFNLSNSSKIETIKSLKGIMDGVLTLVIIISVIEIIFTHQYRDFLGVHSVNRGIGGFYLVSIFGSGPSLANFIGLYIIVWHLYYFGLGNRIDLKSKQKIIIALVVGLLSFSRKEVLFIFLFLLFFPYPNRSKLKKWIKKGMFFLGLFIGLFVYYLTFFAEANTVALSSKYIRWRIVKKSYEIYLDYIPWGTGPGTYGSRASLMMSGIYEKYNIGPEMLGYASIKKTGPIYDAFLFTFITEIGLGVLILAFFFYKLKASKTIFPNRHIRFIKSFIIVFTLMLSLFMPILTTTFGFLCLIIIALTIEDINILKFRKLYA